MRKVKLGISKSVICIETGEIFKSVNHAGKELCLNVGNISLVCSGKRKTCSGLHFKYYNGDKNEITK